MVVHSEVTGVGVGVEVGDTGTTVVLLEWALVARCLRPKNDLAVPVFHARIHDPHRSQLSRFVLYSSGGTPWGYPGRVHPRPVLSSQEKR